MGLTVTVLGRSGSYPGPGEACSGYLVRAGDTAVLVDAGSGTLANLQRHIGLRDVDAVIITHEHPDHWTDLSGLYVASKYYLHRKQLPVFAPASVCDAVYYKEAPLDWRVVTDGTVASVDGMAMRFSRTDHPPETLAVRIDADGRSFAYSSDTGPNWSFDRLGEGIHLALCEATFLDGDDVQGQHLNAAQAGAMARAARVESLLLTHLQPGTDPEASRREASATFEGDVRVADQNEVYEV